MTSVVLPPQSPLFYRKINEEPQYVTAKPPNRACVYIDSQDCVLETNKVSMIISTMKSRTDRPAVLISNVNRIALASAAIHMVTPNVNPRNYTITFFSSSSNSLHTVDLAEGFYSTSVALITHIVTRLNTLTGASGLTFSQAAVPGFPDTYSLISAGGNYYFSLDCSAIKKGYQLYALPIDQTLTSNKTVGSMGLFYTKYVDFCCPTLMKYAKVKSTSTNNISNLFFRINLTDFTVPLTTYLSEATVPDANYSFEYSESVSIIEFELRDQFGDLLYLPQLVGSQNSGFWWNCSLLVEC